MKILQNDDATKNTTFLTKPPYLIEFNSDFNSDDEFDNGPTGKNMFLNLIFFLKNVF